MSVGPRKGELFQPSSMAQYLKEIFVDFKKKGIQYDHAKDFNGEGDYHTVLINLWKQEMEKDPLLQELEQQHLTWMQTENFAMPLKHIPVIRCLPQGGDKTTEDHLYYMVFTLG